MYSSLTQFKDYIGVDQSDTSQDVLLTSFLNTAMEKINNLCGVDSFLKATYTQKIEKRGIYDTPRGLEFYLKNKPIASIDKLNGIDYNGVLGTDYLILYDRRCIFKTLTLNDWGMLEVHYTAGYETIPYDLQLLEMMLASGMYQEHNNEGVQMYRLGDEQITFGAKTGNYGILTPDQQYFSFTTLLNKYKNFNLPL